MTMTVLAHAGDVVQIVLYVAPLLFIVAVLVRTTLKDRRAGATDAEKEGAPTLDEVMDDKS